MCGSKLLTKTVSLTPTPPGNDFLTKEELGKDEHVYPLDLYFCEDCHHVQLGHTVDPEILYQKNYTYVSATSAQFVSHLQTYAVDMIDRFDLKPGMLVSDIGSNDGTCLGFFQDKGMKVVGVDPANEWTNFCNSSLTTLILLSNSRNVSALFRPNLFSNAINLLTESSRWNLPPIF